MPPAFSAFSSRVDAALAFAARAHRAQFRKGTDIPYIVHPVSVAFILDRHGFDEDLIMAGMLHDTVEDTDVSLDAIRAAFGDDVAALVGAVSEKKVEEDGAKRPWKVRKAEALDHFATADARVAALKAADMLHNLQSTLADVRTLGAAAFDRFNAPAADWLWYHQEMGARVGARLGDHPLARELDDAVAELARLA
jgi:(p)ppGpp synthase/HD superfamily hydrolase